LPIARAVPLPGFGAAKLGNLPWSERVHTIPGRTEKEGNTKYEITGIGLELDNSDKETIQSKASKKKQKDRKREDNRLRQVLQRKLSMKKMEHLVVNRGREQLIGNAKGNTQQLDQRSEPE